VRLVKTIGDAAMLVSPEAGALLEATLSLIESAEEIEGFPQLRGGAAFGPALNRSGDWYGRPVNLASRITGEAQPGTLVATRELCGAAGEVCEWTSVGTRSLKGVEASVELFRASQRRRSSRSQPSD
jgi:adenylate cyclase